MRYEVRPFDASDLPKLTAIHLDAYKSNGIIPCLWPHLLKDERFQLHQSYIMAKEDGSRTVNAVEIESGYACHPSC